MKEGTRELPVSSNRVAESGNKSNKPIKPEKQREDSLILRKISSRLAIYRKLKELGHSDDTIIAVYNKKFDKEN